MIVGSLQFFRQVTGVIAMSWVFRKNHANSLELSE